MDQTKLKWEVFQHSYPNSVLQIFLVVTTTKPLLLLFLLFKENTSKIQNFKWSKFFNLLIFSLCYTLLNEFPNMAHFSCGHFSVVVLVLFVSSSFVLLLLKILVRLCNDDGFHRFATIKASSCAAARHSQQGFDRSGSVQHTLTTVSITWHERNDLTCLLAMYGVYMLYVAFIHSVINILLMRFRTFLSYFSFDNESFISFSIILIRWWWHQHSDSL